MKKKITLISIVMLIIMSLVTSVQAYQSTSKGNSKSESAEVWIKGIRQMEESGGGLGLTEAIDETTLLAQTDPNNIDVHLLKNTEYGAILLLGASDYGKQGESISDRRMDRGKTTVLTEVQASTTGNRYGVYEMGYYNMSVSSYNDYEWTAAGGSSFLPDVASRYIDRYTTTEDSAKDGDATVETKKWHGASGATWLGGASYGFYRGYDGAFSYYNIYSSYINYARAGVVVGAGI